MSKCIILHVHRQDNKKEVIFIRRRKNKLLLYDYMEGQISTDYPWKYKINEIPVWLKAWLVTGILGDSKDYFYGKDKIKERAIELFPELILYD